MTVIGALFATLAYLDASEITFMTSNAHYSDFLAYLVSFSQALR